MNTSKNEGMFKRHKRQIFTFTKRYSFEKVLIPSLKLFLMHSDDERDRVIIEVVGGATNVQRQAIKEAYNITYERVGCGSANMT